MALLPGNPKSLRRLLIASAFVNLLLVAAFAGAIWRMGGWENARRAMGWGRERGMAEYQKERAARFWDYPRSSSDVVFLQSMLSWSQLQCLYRASDGVLANSGIEPFGLVGLEAMACGGLSFLGATGEDYATSGHDAISLQSSSPNELVAHLLYLRAHPDLAMQLRHQARKTAARFTWSHVIHTHIAPLLFSREPACV